MGCTLIDAQERNRESPETFELPDQDSIVAVKVGDHVKIGVEIGPDKAADASAERFWVRVTGIVTTTDMIRYTGTIDNELRLTPFHRLKRHDSISFEARHLLSVSP